MRKKLKKLFLFLLLLAALLVACNHYFKLYAFNPYSVCMTRSLRVMTWNVHNSDPGFKQRQKAVAAEILKQDADVVLINEFYLKGSVELDSIVRGAYPFVSEVGANYGCGDILYSRYPIQNSERVERYGFPTLIYEFKLLLNNQTIRLIGCHLISSNNFSKGHRYTVQQVGDITTLPDYYAVYKKGQERRTQEAELIREYLLAEDLPTIVLGDMNDFSGTSPLNTLERTGLKDAWWERGKGFGVTFREGWMRFRLDHILYDSHWNPISIRVVQSDLSDHLPLVGEFELGK